MITLRTYILFAVAVVFVSITTAETSNATQAGYAACEIKYEGENSQGKSLYRRWTTGYSKTLAFARLSKRAEEGKTAREVCFESLLNTSEIYVDYVCTTEFFTKKKNSPKDSVSYVDITLVDLDHPRGNGKMEFNFTCP